jgi:hypothetical protein
VADRVEDLLEAFIAQHVSQNRSARATSQMLRRESAARRLLIPSAALINQW